MAEVVLEFGKNAFGWIAISASRLLGEPPKYRLDAIFAKKRENP